MAYLQGLRESPSLRKRACLDFRVVSRSRFILFGKEWSFRWFNQVRFQDIEGVPSSKTFKTDTIQEAETWVSHLVHAMTVILLSFTSVYSFLDWESCGTGKEYQVLLGVTSGRSYGEAQLFWHVYGSRFLLLTPRPFCFSSEAQTRWEKPQSTTCSDLSTSFSRWLDSRCNRATEKEGARWIGDFLPRSQSFLHFWGFWYFCSVLFRFFWWCSVPLCHHQVRTVALLSANFWGYFTLHYTDILILACTLNPRGRWKEWWTASIRILAARGLFFDSHLLPLTHSQCLFLGFISRTRT